MLFRQPFSVRVPLPNRGKGVKEKGARGRNQKREGRCESLGRSLPSLLWCLPRTILRSFPVSEAEQYEKSLFVCISSNTDTLLIFLQDNIPGEALFCSVECHNYRLICVASDREKTACSRGTIPRLQTVFDGAYGIISQAAPEAAQDSFFRRTPLFHLPQDREHSSPDIVPEVRGNGSHHRFLRIPADFLLRFFVPL